MQHYKKRSKQKLTLSRLLSNDSRRRKANPLLGSSFDDFLRAEALFDEAKAITRALAEQLEDGIVPVKLNTSFQLDSLVRAAHAVGSVMEIRLKRPERPIKPRHVHVA